MAAPSASERMPCPVSMAAWAMLPVMSCTAMRRSNRMEELKSFTRLSTALVNRPCQSCMVQLSLSYLFQFFDSFARSRMDRPNRLMKPAASAWL